MHTEAYNSTNTYILRYYFFCKATKQQNYVIHILLSKAFIIFQKEIYNILRNVLNSCPRSTLYC